MHGGAAPLLVLLLLRFKLRVQGLGLGAALVQRERLTPGDVRLALGLTWVVCTAGALCVVASAPALAWFFRSPEVVPLLRAMAPNLLLVGLGAVPVALLRRELRFREQAAVETGSYALGYGVVEWPPRGRARASGAWWRPTTRRPRSRWWGRMR
ncbi:MAG: oligosaccharide flippase family protein [Deltaproteobacteria bacterium]|nr:oligosaccharide flippase family protein [Deltaproteobacteria bacterium]